MGLDDSIYVYENALTSPDIVQNVIKDNKQLKNNKIVFAIIFILICLISLITIRSIRKYLDFNI